MSDVPVKSHHSVSTRSPLTKFRGGGEVGAQQYKSICVSPQTKLSAAQNGKGTHSLSVSCRNSIYIAQLTVTHLNHQVTGVLINQKKTVYQLSYLSTKNQFFACLIFQIAQVKHRGQTRYIEFLTSNLSLMHSIELYIDPSWSLFTYFPLDAHRAGHQT